MLKSLRRLAIVFSALALALGIGPAAAQSAGERETTSAAVQALQNQILADPQLAGQVHSLSDNPLVREALADPAVADALNRGDFGALLTNPKIQRLTEDPAMQNLTREVAPPRWSARLAPMIWRPFAAWRLGARKRKKLAPPNAEELPRQSTISASLTKRIDDFDRTAGHRFGSFQQTTISRQDTKPARTRLTKSWPGSTAE